jgi:chorismate synthase
MGSNRFGELFTITTWGESHGKAIGVVIDGCPSGIEITEAQINSDLKRRAPGRNPYTSPRKEEDVAEILSGVFEGMTTGTPISIVIWNRDADSSKYDSIKDLLRPGHANFGYLQKYGIFDHRGGGRASARETASRVAAAAIAKALLETQGISLFAYLSQVGNIELATKHSCPKSTQKELSGSTLTCPDKETEHAMMTAIEAAKQSGDSLGGVVEFQIHGLPPGLGDPIYQKLDSRLGAAMMSIPASKGFELGAGFAAAAMSGSQHNDAFAEVDGKISTTTNHAGGILGGISSGMPIVGRVVFKATSSIMKPQQTVDLDGKSAEFRLPEGSRHDPCVAVRAPAIVEAMAALVIADALLLNRGARL